MEITLTKNNENENNKNIKNKKVSRVFCFTWNNYPSNYRDIFNEHIKDIKFLITGEEVSKSGTPHLQGFIRLINTTTFNVISKRFGNSHVEIALGSDKQNIDYCMGIGETAKSHGKEPANPDKIFMIGEIGNLGTGKRTDLIDKKNAIKTAIQTGTMTSKEIINSMTTNYQEIKYVETLLKYNDEPRVYVDSFKFIWIYGPTETGKTKYVLSNRFKKEYEEGKVYIAMNTSKWWDGYDGQEILIIDDFRDSFCSFSNLLQIAQPIEYRVENKGGSRQLKALTIVITSCYAPIDVYNGVGEKRQQLYRRITELLHFYKLDVFKDETEQLKEFVASLKLNDESNEISFSEDIKIRRKANIIV